MSKRSIGFYGGKNGEVLVSFETGVKGVPIESLLPPEGRGKGFADFLVADYFSLAELVLVSPEDFEAFQNDPAFNAATAQQPVKASLPLDLDYLKLRLPEGRMNPERTADVFSIVAAYWRHSDTMATRPGYVAAALHRGMTPAEIIAFVKENSQPDPETGKLRLVFPKASMGEELLDQLLPDDLSPADLSDQQINWIAQWLSSVPAGHATFELPQRLTEDLNFLGLLDAAGVVDKSLAHKAREFIWNRLDQPDFPALWRQLQQPATATEEPYDAFNLYIAELADRRVDNLAFVKAVAELDQTKLAVPTERLYRASRVLWELDRAGKARRSDLEKTLKVQVLDLGRWLHMDTATLFLRRFNKMVVEGTSTAEIEAHLETQLSKAGNPQQLEEHKRFFARKDLPLTLQETGVADEQGRWSEVGYVRQALMAEEARQKEIPPSLEWMRWALHRRYHADQPVPFAWALVRDRLSSQQVQRARLYASMALSGGMTGEKFQIGEQLTPEQFDMLWKFGAWLSNDLEAYLKYEYSDFSWLAVWPQRLTVDGWQVICDFVFGKLNETPDINRLERHLLEQGVITLKEWKTSTPEEAAPFSQGEKIGRNDPCPCGSGKKYKKCCGR